MANSLPVKHGIKGGLDRDTEYGEVRDGNYTDAQNAQFIAKGDNESMVKQPYLGNEFIFDKGSVVSQNKKWRLYLTADAQPLPFQDFFTFNLFRTDKATNIFNLVQGPLGTVGSYRSAISGALAAAGISNVITDGNDYIDIEITETPTYDYHIELSGIGNNNAGVESDVRIIVIQESIAQNLTGVLYDIGSFDLNGDLFIFSTPRDLKPRNVDIFLVFNSSGSVGIQTTVGHNLSTGDEISIVGTGICDGIWLVTVLSSVSFSLVNSTFTTGLSNQGSIVLDYTGVGEIGVMTYNETTEVYTYTRLLRSKELGFCREAQIDVDAEINALGKTLYFNQYKYLPPRVFYYNGSYITDGALNFVSDENRYDYGNIASEIKNVLNIQTATLDLVSVGEGGSVKAGNKQYFIRLLGDEGSLFGTDFHAFTGNVNIYSPSIGGDPDSIVGNISGTVTSKRVTLRISNILQEVYSQVELCVAEWFGDAVTFSVVRRESITGDSMLIEHTGFEVTRNLSAEEVSRVVSEIGNIGGQRIVDNRLVYHDITYRQEQDFTDWASSFTHTIIKQNVRGNGFIQDNRFGGYQDPQNVFRFMGYSWFEVYRFGVRVYFKDGGASKVFWIDDIRFDILSSNVSTPNRRVGLQPTSYDLNISNDDDYFAVGVQFSNLDLNYLIDGVPIKDLIGRIEICTVDLSRSLELREVKFSGFGVPGVTGKYSGVNVSQIGGSFDIGYGGFYGFSFRTIVTPFPFPSGQEIFQIGSNSDSINNPFNSNPSYQNMYGGVANPFFASNQYIRRKRDLFIFSNDIIFGGDDLDYRAGDQVINFGPYFSFSSGQFRVTGSSSDDSFIRDYQVRGMYGSPIFINLNFGTLLQRGGIQVSPVSNVAYFGKTRLAAGTASDENGYLFETSFATELSLDIDSFGFGGKPDNGAWYVSYYRPVQYLSPDSSKFGDRDESVYNVVCSSVLVDGNSPAVFNNLATFGGDTFVSRVQMKMGANAASLITSVGGGGTGISFVSQSSVNPLMRVNDENNTNNAAFPANPLGDYGSWLESEFLDQTEYDTSYNRHSFPQYAAFVDNETTQVDFPTRIIWSDLNPEGSFFDLYRSFPVLNFVDLNRAFGRVMHIEVLNDELFTLQHRSVQRQYFNTTGTLTSEPDELIVLGNAGVLGRKGLDLSAYGTRHKWSVVKGRTITGRDVMYWYNVERGVFVKLSGEGIEPISVTKGMFNFFNKAAKFLFDKDTPALGFGICGGWNERFQELRMSFRGYKDVGSWNETIPYFPGSVVKLTGEGFDLIDLYEANDFSRGDFPKESSLWAKIPHTNKEFYNEFSIVYSEAKDTFATLLSPQPLIYLPWRKDIVTQRYGVWVDGYGNFIENYGKYNVWYEVGANSLSKEFFVEPVINYNSDVIKTFNAIYVNSDNPPDRVEFRTPGQETFLVASDFEAREGMWVSEIKNDSTATGLNDGDTSQMFGRYIRVKLIYLPDKKESLRDVRIRLMFNARYLQT